jgi:DNA-binding NtrC family response regulator
MASDPSRLVLLVEDDAAAAEALLLILNDWGAEVIHGARGDALAAANGRLADVGWIITDFHLGQGEDGISLVKRLRTSAPTARVLVLSGSFTGRATAEAAQAGFDVMQKPARAKSIIEWLERA